MLGENEYVSYTHVDSETQQETPVKYPLFWSATYQQAFETFLSCLASHLDSAGYLDDIVTGYSVETTEPSFYNKATLTLKQPLTQKGIRFDSNDKPYLRWTNYACPVDEVPPGVPIDPSHYPEGFACRKYAQATKAFWECGAGRFPAFRWR